MSKCEHCPRASSYLSVDAVDAVDLKIHADCVMRFAVFLICQNLSHLIFYFLKNFKAEL